MINKKYKKRAIISGICCGAFTLLFILSGIFMDALDKILSEDIFIILLAFIAIGWVVSFFASLIFLNMGMLKTCFPKLYNKITNKTEDYAEYMDVGSSSKKRSWGDGIKRIWNTPLYMYIISLILFFFVAFVFLVMEISVIEYLLFGGIFIIVSAILCFKLGRSDDLHKWIFVAIVVGILVTVLFLSGVFEINSSSTSQNKCGVCGGSGLVPKNQGWGYTNCPYCKGTGIPPL